MYNLTVNNNYIYNVDASDGKTVKKGANHTFNKRGSLYLNIPGMGEMNFIDLGDTKLPGYDLKENWGVLVRFSNKEAYYRYEGEGQLTLTIDNLGTCTLSTNNGSMIPVYIEEFIVDITGVPIH